MIPGILFEVGIIHVTPSHGLLSLTVGPFIYDSSGCSIH